MEVRASLAVLAIIVIVLRATVVLDVKQRPVQTIVIVRTEVRASLAVQDTLVNVLQATAVLDVKQRPVTVHSVNIMERVRLMGSAFPASVLLVIAVRDVK